MFANVFVGTASFVSVTVPPVVSNLAARITKDMSSVKDGAHVLAHILNPCVNAHTHSVHITSVATAAARAAAIANLDGSKLAQARLESTLQEHDRLGGRGGCKASAMRVVGILHEWNLSDLRWDLDSVAWQYVRLITVRVLLDVQYLGL